MSKFAPITSALLARKGDAGPSVVPVKFPFAWSHERRAAEPFSEGDTYQPAAPQPYHEAAAPKWIRHVRPAPSGPDGPAPRTHRITVALSPREYETLGIIAVKRGMTRHQVVRQALDGYLEEIAREYRTQCNCIATGCACSGSCPAA